MAVNYHTGEFPPDDRVEWSKLIPLLGPTSAAIARYDGVLEAIPNPWLLLTPLTTEEAVLSSRIEGTQATVLEVLESEGEGRVPDSVDRQLDIQEVVNYISAMREAETLLETYPLSQKVIKKSHAILLQGVRGEGKSPGEYRRIANWIGPPNCTIDEARFVPIGAHELPDAISTGEKYIHQDHPDRLVQLAILHAEFEALHPFLDGNGRLGRMLVPLFLWQHKLINKPAFYISSYFEANRDAYYDELLSVSRDGDWTGWIKFFLEALKKQAEYNYRKALDILELYESIKTVVSNEIRSQYTPQTLDWIFKRPIFSTRNFQTEQGAPPASARRILKALDEIGVLEKIVPASGRSAAIYTFPALLDIVMVEGNFDAHA